jgi:hypothetical protein
LLLRREKVLSPGGCCQHDEGRVITRGRRGRRERGYERRKDGKWREKKKRERRERVVP